MQVRIERYYKYPDILRQTPGGLGVWEGIQFTEEKLEECDYLIILDYPRDKITTNVNPNNVIHVCLEPPNEMSKYRQYSNKSIKINNVISQKEPNKGNILSHGGLPWHVNKSYDFLINTKQQDLVKDDTITWVTSNQAATHGHFQRMEFLNRIKDIKNIQLYGRGINPINDKWDVLCKSKYGIAYENYKANYYWTEKISDCYLAYCMPLYFGTDKICNYFPKESLIILDPYEKKINLQIESIIKSNIWKKNLDAIVYARDLVLNHYQFFPLVSKIIRERELTAGIFAKYNRENLNIPGGHDFFDNYPLHESIRKLYFKLLRRFSNRISKLHTK